VLKSFPEGEVVRWYLTTFNQENNTVKAEVTTYSPKIPNNQSKN
jgi:hypothetical protein